MGKLMLAYKIAPLFLYNLIKSGTYSFRYRVEGSCIWQQWHGFDKWMPYIFARTPITNKVTVIYLVSVREYIASVVYMSHICFCFLCDAGLAQNPC